MQVIGRSAGRLSFLVEMGLRGLMEAARSAKEEARLRQVTSQPSFSSKVYGPHGSLQGS